MSVGPLRSDAVGHEIHLEPNTNKREWIYMDAIKIRARAASLTAEFDLISWCIMFRQVLSPYIRVFATHVSCYQH